MSRPVTFYVMCEPKRTTPLKMRVDQVKLEVDQYKKQVQVIVHRATQDERIQRMIDNLNYSCEEMTKELQKIAGRNNTIYKASILLPALIVKASPVFAQADKTGETVKKLQEVFLILREIAIAVGEPILWFYALTAIILMATGKNKAQGWGRLKQVMYSYLFLRCLPALFALVGWLSEVLMGALSGVSIPAGGN